MVFEQIFDSPFVVNFSFDTLIQNMEKECEKNPHYAMQHRDILEEVKLYPELRTGIKNPEYLDDNKDIIHRLLSDLFPPLLSENEIKAVSLPFFNFICNPTKRLQNILEDAGHDFQLTFSGISSDQFYVMACCVILSQKYGVNISGGYSFIYDIPKKDGIINHYRILNNADFIEIKATERSKTLSQEEIDNLLDNFTNIDLWKEKFPPNSWEMYGFGVINIYDATIEVAISNLKSHLIQHTEDHPALREEFKKIFRSIFQIADLEIGYTAIDFKENKFIRTPVNNVIESIILSGLPANFSDNGLCEKTFHEKLEKRRYFSISDMEKFNIEFPDSPLGEHLIRKGIQSAIFTPIIKDKKLLGLIELISKTKLLNSINANKMENILPYLEDTLDRLYTSIDNHSLALIQQEYTSIHPSVYWKFKEEVSRHIAYGPEHQNRLPYRSIAFDNIIPLYGQSDIKNSSIARNNAILKDLKMQLDLVSKLLESLKTSKELSDVFTTIENYKNDLHSNLKANTESDFQSFLQQNIHPVLDQLKYEDVSNNQKITNYYNQLDIKSKGIYHYRKKFDDSLSFINKELSDLIDKRQEEQQKKFPFYYERFKTDGVEHNMYIGASIAPWLSYDSVFLKNLRVWQLRIICESEIHFNKIRPQLPQNMDITSLILVYSNTISIRFRMDEKRFDVDGSYNARYEMIKKRIDKAFVKGTNERIVESGKICIVFSQQQEEKDYLEYIKLLQSEGQLKDSVEILDIEDLQGISGLKVIRVAVNYDCNCFPYSFYNKI